jgi:hypothetical protein
MMISGAWRKQLPVLELEALEIQGPSALLLSTIEKAESKLSSSQTAHGCIRKCSAVNRSTSVS